MGGTGLKTTTYLQMTAPGQLKPKRVVREDLEVRRVEAVAPEFHWFLHQAVGAEFRWGGHEDWGEAEWRAHAEQPGLVAWVAYVGGVPAGYFELLQHEDGSVEILYFGILRRHFGQGLGGHLLTEAVEQAWGLGADRVWLHTCTHDHEHAVANYLARGFTVFKTEEGPANRPRESALFSQSKLG